MLNALKIFEQEKTVKERNKLFLHTYSTISNTTFRSFLKTGINHVINNRTLKIDKYFWPHALLATSIEHSYNNSQNPEDLHCLISYYKKWIKNGFKYKHLDHTMNGYTMIFVFEKTNNKEFEDRINELANWLIHTHPRDSNGSLPYRNNGKEVILVDGLGMVCPFLCRYGKVFNKPEATDLAVIQLINFLNFGMHDDLYLPYHAFKASTKLRMGIVGWGRGVGWLLIGLVDSLENIDKNHDSYLFLKNSFVKLVFNVLSYQRQDGYFSWQLETNEGPKDTSTTSMISYSIIKGLELGFIEENTVQKQLQLSIIALLESTSNGIVNDCSAECKGVGMYPQKFGNFPWAQGPTLSTISLVNKVL